MGCYLLIYLVGVNKLESLVLKVYKKFCDLLEVNPKEKLVEDLTNLEPYNTECLFYLCRRLYSLAPELSQDNTDLLHLFISNIDGDHLRSLVFEVVSQRLVMIGPDCTSVMVTSLTWETMEQWAFWQLVEAHSVNTETILTFLPSG